MLTRQAPALLDALRGVSSDDSAAQMLQAFANCNASLSHRGTVNLSKQPFPNRGGVMQPYANGGGVSGVSLGGPGDYGGIPPESYSRYDGGFAPDGTPGRSQAFYQNANLFFPGGPNFTAPDITTSLPPWGWEPGMGSGQIGPTNLYYGTNYYGANSYNIDYSFGGPSNSFLTQINTGGDYYDNSTHYGAGGYQTNFYEGGRYYDGDTYFTEGDTSYTSIYPGGDNTFYGDSYYTALYPGGDTFIGGDTFSSYEITNRGGDYYAGDWHTVNNDNSITIGGPHIDNTTNYSYGGDTFVVGGDTIFNGNTTINNTTVTNYGNPGSLPPGPGIPGPGGGVSPRGAPGAPGAPGGFGPGGGGGFVPGGGGGFVPGGGGGGGDGGGGFPALGRRAFVSRVQPKFGESVSIEMRTLTVAVQIDPDSCTATGTVECPVAVPRRVCTEVNADYGTGYAP